MIRPGMGLRQDARDRRDRALYAAVPDIATLPPGADLTAVTALPMDQGPVGACTGYSGSGLFYTVMVKDGHPRPFVPSQVFLYRAARELGGYVEEDAGAELRNVLKAAARWGLPPMSNLRPRFKSSDLADSTTSIFPVDSIWRRVPSPGNYADAERRQALSYHRLGAPPGNSLLPDLLQCLADGWPAVLGFAVFRSFYGPRGPWFAVPDPQPGERDLGGHAVLAIGYDMATRRVLFRNSWGPDAHEGKPDFTLSFQYVERFAWDCWTARSIEGFRA